MTTETFQCDVCGSTEYRDVPIHDGQSTRRDCADCGRTCGFPSWFGEARADWPTNVKRLFPGGDGDRIAPLRSTR